LKTSVRSPSPRSQPASKRSPGPNSREAGGGARPETVRHAEDGLHPRHPAEAPGHRLLPILVERDPHPAQDGVPGRDQQQVAGPRGEVGVHEAEGPLERRRSGDRIDRQHGSFDDAGLVAEERLDARLRRQLAPGLAPVDLGLVGPGHAPLDLGAAVGAERRELVPPDRVGLDAGRVDHDNRGGAAVVVEHDPARPLAGVAPVRVAGPAVAAGRVDEDPVRGVLDPQQDPGSGHVLPQVRDVGSKRW